MSAIFGKTPKAADPVRMPVPDGPVAKASGDAERRKILARSGRSSTRLTETPGQTAYRNSLLGQN